MKNRFTNTRRWLSALACCALLMSLVSCIEITKKPVISEGLEYQFNEADMTCAVLGIGTCTDTDLRIPETLNGYRVTSVAPDAFSACNQIISVTVPNTVTTIGSNAFSHCDAMTTVQLSSALKQIEASAFVNCDALQAVVFPDGLISIGDHAFALCKGLSNVIFPESLEQIGAYAFRECYALSSLTIPKKLTSIGEKAFVNTSYLLEQISVSEGNPVYHSVGNSLIHTESKTLLVGCKNSVIPDDGSVTAIGESAFEGCSKLTAIAIPKSITIIGKHAFYGCSTLGEVVLPESLTEIGIEAFASCSAIKQISIPSSVTVIGQQAFQFCNAMESVTFASAPQRIDSHAFEHCTALNAVHITDLVAWCNIQFQNEQANPLYHAKALCLSGEELQSVVIPDGVTSLGDYLFVGGDRIKSVSIPKSVTSITPLALCGMGDALEQIIVDKNNPVYRVSNRCLIDIDQKTLVKGCKKAFIPDDGSVEQIGAYAFYGCDISGIDLPATIKMIGNYAFAYTTGATEVLFPEGILHIGTGAFKKCDELTKISISKTLRSVGQTPFSESRNIDTVIYDGGITEWRRLEEYYDFFSHTPPITCTDGRWASEKH